MEQQQPTSLSYQYRMKYAGRAPADFLEQLLEQGKENRHQGAEEQFITAHIHTDLAVLQPESAESHLDAAESLYEEILQTHEQRMLEGCFDPSRSAVTLVRSILHAAEIPQWRQATQGQRVTPDYEELLDATKHALSYVKQWGHSTDTRSSTFEHSAARSALVDFTVVLLGARACHKGEGGWTGRLALFREDEGPTYSGYNPNWDVGVCMAGLKGNYKRPARIQLYRHKKKGKQAYWAAGVITLSEESCGLYQPQYLINSCVNEFDAASTKNYRSLQLDKLTARVQQKIIEGNGIVRAKRQELRFF